jgi:hypothetical protein
VGVEKYTENEHVQNAIFEHVARISLLTLLTKTKTSPIEAIFTGNIDLGLIYRLLQTPSKSNEWLPRYRGKPNVILPNFDLIFHHDGAFADNRYVYKRCRSESKLSNKTRLSNLQCVGVEKYTENEHVKNAIFYKFSTSFLTMTELLPTNDVFIKDVDLGSIYRLVKTTSKSNEWLLSYKRKTNMTFCDFC